MIVFSLPLKADRDEWCCMLASPQSSSRQRTKGVLKLPTDCQPKKRPLCRRPRLIFPFFSSHLCSFQGCWLFCPCRPCWPLAWQFPTQWSTPVIPPVSTAPTEATAYQMSSVLRTTWGTYMNQELPAILPMVRPASAVSRESHHVSNILYNLTFVLQLNLWYSRQEKGPPEEVSNS